MKKGINIVLLVLINFFLTMSSMDVPSTSSPSINKLPLVLGAVCIGAYFYLDRLFHAAAAMDNSLYEYFPERCNHIPELCTFSCRMKRFKAKLDTAITILRAPERMYSYQGLYAPYSDKIVIYAYPSLDKRLSFAMLERSHGWSLRSNSMSGWAFNRGKARHAVWFVTEPDFINTYRNEKLESGRPRLRFPDEERRERAIIKAASWSLSQCNPNDPLLFALASYTRCKELVYIPDRSSPDDYHAWDTVESLDNAVELVTGQGSRSLMSQRNEHKEQQVNS